MKVNVAAIAIIILLLTSGKAGAQDARTQMDQMAKRLNAYTREGAETSVYLTSDKDVYGSGEDLWFHAFVLDKRFFTLSEADKTIYLQLVHKDTDSAVWSEMYPVTGGVAFGQVYLDQNLQEGHYMLRAYSTHSFLDGQDLFYATAPVRIVKEFNTIKRAAPVSMGSSGGQEAIQFNVFPEGGNLIAGLENRVAFKAVNKNGDPVAVNGSLLKNNEPVLRFNTAHAGMGSFSFKPEKGVQYLIRLDNYKDSLYKVQLAQDSGVTMQLAGNKNDSLFLKIATRNTGTQAVYIRLQTRGMMQAAAAAALKDSLMIRIPVGEIPQGIAEITLFDSQLRPLAERLVFLHPDRKLRIGFSYGKDKYRPKEKITMRVSTKDAQGKPVPAVLTLRVRDRLMTDPANVGDIMNYYLLSTQLRGKIYDPAYYFDSTNQYRREALDLLLLTQGWRQYAWHETVLKEDLMHQPVRSSDSLPVNIVPAGKAGKGKLPASLMVFNYNRSVVQPLGAAADGKFYLSPEQLATGPRFFIKYFSEQEFNIRVYNPFDVIRSAVAKSRPVDVVASRKVENERTAADTGFLQYGKRLQEVTISAKGRGLGDKYLGLLDSIARYEGNTDYVGVCNILNCPACGSGTKPVEGVVYTELTEAKRLTVSSHPFPFTQSDIRRVPYKYPKYTEEELLKKFKMAVAKGYYQSRKFYEPDYDKEDRAAPDIRNVIAWKPAIVTDQQGEATVSFFSSDVRGRFEGILEGVDEHGLLGTVRFHFYVTTAE